MALVTQPELVPEVSVVIASYNARETIDRCLSAVTTLETPFPFEVVVVDELLASGTVRPSLETVGMHVWTVKV